MPRYVSKDTAARHAHRTERWVRNQIGAGRLRGFWFGPNDVRIDLDELEVLLRANPTLDGRKMYGEKSVIVDMSKIALPAEQAPGGQQ